MADVSIIRCTNKGCYSQDYHKLDLDTGEVMCLDCQKPIVVSEYMKKTLKLNKQTLKRIKPANAVECPHCKVVDTPALFDYGKIGENRMPVVKAGCTHCNKPNDHLSRFFVKALELNPNVKRIKVNVVGGETVVTEEPSVPVRVNTQLTTEADESKTKPSSAQDMLDRVKIKYTGEVTPQETIDVASEERVIKRVNPSDAGAPGPKTAEQILERAGVPLRSMPEE